MSARRLFFIVGLFLGLVLTGRAAVREFERTFAVQPGCTVKLETYRGSVTVVESDRPEVHVTLRLEIATDDEAEADRAHAALQLDAAETDNTVTLRARNPRETGVRFVWDDKQQLDLAWRIEVPRASNAEVLTRDGGINVGSLTGHVIARTDTGSISLKRIDGSVDARTETGDVILSRCSGPVKIRVLRGTIRTGTIGGPADLKNTTGDIEVLSARASLVASAEAGDIDVGFPRDLSSDAQLTTSGGSIRVKIDPAASCTIRATTTWGRVENKLPLTLDPGPNTKRALTAHLNQGGPTLTLHASGGHVKLSPGETDFE